MKHADRLAAWLEELDLVIDESALQVALRHLEWVLKANERLNLTAPVDRDAAVRVHLLDSLAAVPEIIQSAKGLMVDLGTGGGFPGIPLAVASNRPALLVDSVSKKLTALEEYVASEHLQHRITMFKGRSEELASVRPQLATVVVARAVAELPVLVELASPLLEDGGSLVALKGRPSDEEIERSVSAGRLVGFDAPTVRAYTLPGGDEQRMILTYCKATESTVVLPRRPGMAKKKPLA